ncbi:Pre-mRNA-splicing factor CWC22 [Intoshia linei]|uniref:Pre-mRNA-splicing factor CWC22 n=1 Tax=Intoshia linei TaxID=1819745 RepID=A0A177B0T8_9BILA|nr:Pre-mRNA-splicing factor CWC22 [Intoshia linei]
MKMDKRQKNDNEKLQIKKRLPEKSVYIPPAKMRKQLEFLEKGSKEYQKMSWDSLKKSINGLINKVNVANIVNIARELFAENIIRGRGIMIKILMRAQKCSPMFSHVYAALVAILNSKFPVIGELLCKRLILQVRKAYKRNDKPILSSSLKFIAHLINQQVIHEILSLEILVLLLSKPSNDSVECAVGFLREVGAKLTVVSKKGLQAVFERLRSMLGNSESSVRIQYMIEVLFATRKDKFRDNPMVIEELDLIPETDDDQIMHLMHLQDSLDTCDKLDFFQFDPDFEKNEEEYNKCKAEILLGASDDESGSEEDENGDSDEENLPEDAIQDKTGTFMINFRRTIYLRIRSSLNFEEAAHKLLQMEIKPEHQEELCNMIIDCCAEERTYEKFYGMLAQRMCEVNEGYIAHFERIFGEQFTLIHRLETGKLRNVAKLYAHLLFSDTISWKVFEIVNLTEETTTSSSRIFLKILLQELCEFTGTEVAKKRFSDPENASHFCNMFPRYESKHTRFAINFYTSIGLGPLTEDLRKHLLNIKKKAENIRESSSSSSSEESEYTDESGSSSNSE